MSATDLEAIIRSIRPALQQANLNEEERAQFVYDLVREVYEFVKFDVYGPTVDADERSRLGEVLDAALPPTR